MSESQSPHTEPRPDSASTAQAAFEISVNGEARRVPAPCRVADLLDQLELTGQRVAVAVNRAVVMRSRYTEIELAADDRVEILEAVGGG